MELKLKKNGEIICENLKMAESFFSRLKGLMFTDSLKPYDGILIKPCNSIHTFFMNYPIDVVFLSKKMKVIRIIKNLKPYRMTTMVWGAHQVLEVDGGCLSENVEIGDELEVLCTS